MYSVAQQTEIKMVKAHFSSVALAVLRQGITWTGSQGRVAGILLFMGFCFLAIRVRNIALIQKLKGCL